MFQIRLSKKRNLDFVAGLKKKTRNYLNENSALKNSSFLQSIEIYLSIDFIDTRLCVFPYGQHGGLILTTIQLKTAASD